MKRKKGRPEQEPAIKELAGRIRALRQFYRQTQQEFASQLGVSRSHLSEVEALNAKPSIDMVLGISQAFPWVRAEWLIVGDGPMLHSAEQATRDTSVAAELLGKVTVDIIEETDHELRKERGFGLSEAESSGLFLSLPNVFWGNYTSMKRRPGVTRDDAIEAAMKVMRRAARILTRPVDPL